MTTTQRTRMLKWASLQAGGFLFGSTCDSALGTLSLVAGIAGIAGIWM